jgi:P-type Ca2+ transporter type 2C
LVQVCRDGRWQLLPGEQLLPGDRIRLQAGDRVPADARLLEAAELGVGEAALTGEAALVEKRAEAVLPASTPLTERRNCLFQGTEVLRGRATALVTRTGNATELGKIAALVRTAGGESTPLQQRLEGLSKALVGAALVLVAVVVLVGWRLGHDPLTVLRLALSTAVAIVPEGLPAVITVTLAIGSQRMARRAALIRRLPAVETLGSVTVICVDKTGTLTRNRQVVSELRCGTCSIAVNDPPEGTGEFAVDGLATSCLPPPPGATPGLAGGAPDLLLAAGVLCSDAEVLPATLGQGGGMRETGGSGAADPTETALRRRHSRRSEIPFCSERRWMAVWVADPGGELRAPLGEAARDADPLMLVKGAPEVILERCDRWLDGSGLTRLTPAQRRWWLDQARDLAASGLRLLAFATTAAAAPGQEQADERLPANLVLVGLIAQQDPARPEVAEAVSRCREAGIRPVMITGDHPLTARAIAVAIGLIGAGGEVIEGQALERLDDDALREVVGRVSVFARVPPVQKLRIVKALQARGEVVAMTGDGVNDAPALRQAHIGVAMGINGTEVSREAADMVLLDDNFATIVNAVEEGRCVYARIRRFLKYILGSNVGELLTIGSAPLLGLALTPLQILWTNLVTDGVPAMALALGREDGDLMHVPPVDPGESIFARGVGYAILRIGTVFGALVISLMIVAVREGRPWQTMVFTTLCLAQMGHALSAGSDRLLLRVPPGSNPWLLGSVVLTVALQFAVLYVPSLADCFGTTPLAGHDLMLCLAVSAAFLIYLELEKLVRLWRGNTVNMACMPASM